MNFKDSSIYKKLDEYKEKLKQFGAEQGFSSTGRHCSPEKSNTLIYSASLLVKNHKPVCIAVLAAAFLAAAAVGGRLMRTEQVGTVSAEAITTQATSAEPTTEATTAAALGTMLVHYNADGKLYGTKGKFSGLWPSLEKTAIASGQDYIKALMVYVGDNTELAPCDYEQDKFKEINGYGTVHWNQVGHKWPNKYSCAYSGYITYDSANLFQVIKEEETFETTTDSGTSAGGIGAASSADDSLPVLNEIVLSDSAIEVEGEAETASLQKAEVGSDKSEVSTEKAAEKATERATEKISEAASAEAEASSSATSAANTSSEKSSAASAAPSRVVDTSGFAEGSVWGGNSCGTCSLAMALSTLSGVTVSPPEVALAANLLIGRSAWYEVILFSRAQAKLAQLAGFPVYMEPFNAAKKETLDKCLDANGVALFVTQGSDWVANGGRHYIMVRGRVGDTYYTADSGKNPTHGFTYAQISAGYCQQYIVYIYPKTAVAEASAQAATAAK